MDTLLEAVLQVTDVKTALAETGISVGQLEEAVREMRGGAATVDSQSGDQAFEVRFEHHSAHIPDQEQCPGQCGFISKVDLGWSVMGRTDKRLLLTANRCTAKRGMRMVARRVHSSVSR